MKAQIHLEVADAYGVHVVTIFVRQDHVQLSDYNAVVTIAADDA